MKVLFILVNPFSCSWPLLVIGVDAEWKQGHWMCTMSYHVVGSDAGCIRCLITMGPILGAKLFLPVYLGFFFFCFGLWEPHLCTGPHRIKDTNTLDVIRDDYLFGSSNVQIQHRNINSQEEGSVANKDGSSERGLCNNNKNHQYKYQ